jgi:hypothetical protein
MEARWGVDYSSTLSLNPAIDGGGRLTPRPDRFTLGNDPVPAVQEAGGPEGRSGRMRKFSFLPELDPRTVQPVASRCTFNA